MINGILTPAFLQSAGRAGKGKNEIKFISGDADLSIYQVSCDGDITIKTIKNGSAVTSTYSNLSDESVELSCDANTQVSIIGSATKIVFYNWDDDTEEPINISSLNVTKCKTLTYLDISWCQNLTSIDVSENTALTQLYCRNCIGLTALNLSKNTTLTILSCDDCYALTSLDLSKNTALTQLNCDNCSALTALDLSKNTALTELSCDNCSALTALDLSKNTALTQLNCDNCTGLTTISYPATNSDISTDIAGAITAATSTTGTVYTDSAAAYYSTIATAATTKGWTIAQIPA